MPVDIVVGRAGSGKSHYVMETVANAVAESPDGDPIVVIVPDQATYWMESWLARIVPGQVMIRAQVMNFRRFAWRALSALGYASLESIGTAGKLAVLFSAYETVQSQMRVLSRPQPTAAYLDRLQALVDECQEYALEPASMLRTANEIDDPMLAAKLHDTAMLYDAYRTILGHTFVDAQDLLPLYVKHAARDERLSKTRVFVDGFVGFTAQELRVLDVFALQAQDCTITLGAPRSALDREIGSVEDRVFDQSRDTLHRLRERFALRGIVPSVRELELGTHHRFADAPLLSELEDSLFQTGTVAPDTTDVAPRSAAVWLIDAEDRHAEVQGVVREILRMREEEGLSNGAFAIVLTDVSLYETLLADALQEASVPYTMDERMGLRDHPIAVLVTGILQVAASGMSLDAVLRCLKSDLFPVSRLAVDELEEQCIAIGMTNAQSWSFPQALLRTRTKRTVEIVSRLLLSKVGAIPKEGASVAEVARALWDILEDMGVPKRLERMARMAERSGDLATAQVHQQAYQATTRIFDDIVQAFGTASHPITTLHMLFLRAYQGLTVGVIPAALHQVSVVAADRVRAWERSVVFVIGCEDGAFPRRMREDDLLTDRDRETLALLGTEVAPPSNIRQGFERYRVYMALTRATRRLILSCPQTDAAGKSVYRSAVLDDIWRHFGGGRVYRSAWFIQPRGDAPQDVHHFLSTAQAALYMVDALRQVKRGFALPPLAYHLYTAFANGMLEADVATRVLSSLVLRPQSEPLSPSVATALYGQDVRVSVSRLELFSSCAFSHFVSYGLRLKGRRPPQIDIAGRGDFVHAVLSGFVEGLLRDEIVWGDISDDDVLRRFEAVYEEVVNTWQQGLLLRTARARHESASLRKSVYRAIRTLTEHARRGQFTPRGAEVTFGYPDSDIREVPVWSNDTMHMSLYGRIDRIDTAVDEEGQYWFRVIDYKSSERSVQLDSVYYGLTLQLAVYAAVIARHSSALWGQPHDVAGVFYFPVRDVLRKVKGPSLSDAADDVARKQLRMRGLFRRDRTVVVLSDRASAQGSDDLFPKLLTKSGTFHKNVVTADEKEWDLLSRHVLQATETLGARMFAGETEVSPFQKGTRYACSFCEAHAICQFEPATGLGQFRQIPSLKPAQVWDKLAEERGRT